MDFSLTDDQRNIRPAKYLAGEFGFEARHAAMPALGAMGHAQEYHVERFVRESLIPRLAPVGPHMILNFLAEKVMEPPRSYRPPTKWEPRCPRATG